MIESVKLDFMAEVSSLKIRLATAENASREHEDGLKGFQVRSSLESLKIRLAMAENEGRELEDRLKGLQV